MSRLASNRLILPLLTGLSFLTAFIRDILLAKEFGASPTSDLIWLSLLLPAAFEQVIGTPIRDTLISRYSYAEPHYFRGLLVSLKSFISTLLFTGVTILLIRSSPQTILPRDLILSGQTSINLICLAMLMIPCHALYYSQWAFSAVNGGFKVPHARSIFINCCAITACLCFSSNPYAIIWGMIAGMLLNTIAIEVTLLRLFNARLALGNASLSNHRSQHRTEVASVAFTLLLVGLFNQLCVVAERLVASYMQPGTITELSVAYRLSTVILSFGISSFLVPIYSKLESADSGNVRQKIHGVAKLLYPVVLLTAVLCSLLFLFSDHLVLTMFSRGKFSISNAQTAAHYLQSYLIGVPFSCVSLVVVRFLCSLRAFGSLVLSSILYVLFYVSFLLISSYNASSGFIAVSWSISQILYSIMLVAALLISLRRESVSI